MLGRSGRRMQASTSHFFGAVFTTGRTFCFQPFMTALFRTDAMPTSGFAPSTIREICDHQACRARLDWQESTN